MGLAGQAVRQRGQHLAPPGPQEVVVDVRAGNPVFSIGPASFV
jgi:hypothetical protein